MKYLLNSNTIGFHVFYLTEAFLKIEGMYHSICHVENYVLHMIEVQYYYHHFQSSITIIIVLVTWNKNIILQQLRCVHADTLLKVNNISMVIFVYFISQFLSFYFIIF
jgi:hypothetical protein